MKGIFPIVMALLWIALIGGGILFVGWSMQQMVINVGAFILMGLGAVMVGIALWKWHTGRTAPLMFVILIGIGMMIGGMFIGGFLGQVMIGSYNKVCIDIGNNKQSCEETWTEIFNERSDCDEWRANFLMNPDTFATECAAWTDPLRGGTGWSVDVKKTTIIDLSTTTVSGQTTTTIPGQVTTTIPNGGSQPIPFIYMMLIAILVGGGAIGLYLRR